MFQLYRTSQLICSVRRLNGFCMSGILSKLTSRICFEHTEHFPKKATEDVQ